jgi:DNA-binding transcriptional ArsR family regulator
VPRRSAAAAASLERQAPVFSALGDSTRLRLVARLAGSEPQSITHLTEGTGITRQGVTKHLRVLSDAGIVRPARKGRETLWHLERESLEAARRSLERISALWDETLDRLKKYVEE